MTDNGVKGCRAASTAPRVAFLNATFYAYRVPLFEELNRQFRDRFLVIALASRIDRNAWEAASMGSFPRRLINGVTINNRFLTKRTLGGEKTPIGPTMARGLAEELRHFGPDVVISANLGVWTLTSIARGYPTIIYWEGTAHTERTVGAARLLLRRWMARRAPAFVVNGKQSKEYVSNTLGVRDDLIFAGGLGPELSPLQLSTTVHARERTAPIRFSFVGRFIPLKGVSHLLRAARILLDRGYSAHDFDITLVGDGPERTRLQGLSRQLGLDVVLHFVGGVGTSEVWKFFQACDVLVLPSLQDNWPLVVPEAMSMGRAILLSRHAGSASDLVRITENGFTFDPNDHAELARLMSFYIDHSDAAAAHGSRSRQIAAEFTPVKVAQPYIRAVECVWSAINQGDTDRMKATVDAR